ncbi:aminotransferase class V-fold PLP-dependent enzyme [Indiicoccus explosivorum]|uniref:aminotransferase class V-fold PLP-dependent enzyme n=1 Tax=Indiicoccus explosivorum TaxID=1917864 RepID=UPI001F4EE6E0|nr:aminotransferase class V-fold PLP-dependent enzyme [Indiicoccus explosivorum]
MIQTDSLTVKIADTPDEMEQIHRLNYETFAEEIPQHAQNGERRLVDRFHAENTYMIVKRDDEVIGMAAIRGSRPFSLDQKLGTVDTYLPPEAKPCEIRLLSLKSEYRGSRTFFMLCDQLVSHCLHEGFDTVLISGTDRQTRLYRHMGFRPFGPAVGTDRARFQPMLLTESDFTSAGGLFRQLVEKRKPAVNGQFLPGPVPIHESVRKAWASPAISHRSAAFMDELKSVQQKIASLTKVNHVQVAVGTGTLANDLVAGQLSRIGGKGLILANGEFGERLIRQAERWQLPFSVIRKPWAADVALSEVEAALSREPDIRWLWTVHCETSSGYLYLLDELKAVCRRHDALLCVDACSSAGVVPADYSGVHFVSTGSGKGFGSYPGLAIVLHEEPVQPDSRLPAYLDLGTYAEAHSVPFTHSANGIRALHAALDIHTFPDFRKTAEVREQLAAAGFDVIGGASFSPGVVTCALPEAVSSKAFGDRLKARGILISYESGYLLGRNWVQLAFMGDQGQNDPERAVGAMTELLKSGAANKDAHP